MLNGLGFELEKWEKTEAKEIGDYEGLKVGGHVVEIVEASLYKSNFSGNTTVKVCVDIADDDEQKEFFKRQFEANNLSEAKWPSNATKYLGLDEKGLAFTKGFITALEKSNNFKLDFTKDWSQIVGLKCVGVFGLEEFERQDGSIGASPKLQNFRSLDKLNEIKIPKVKLIDGSRVDYEDYINKKVNKKDDSNFENLVQIGDSELPF